MAEVSFDAAKYRKQVQLKLQQDASKLTLRFVQNSALRDSVIEENGRWFLVSRYINRPRRPLEIQHQLILSEDSALCQGLLYDTHGDNHGRSVLDVLNKYERKYYTKNA